LLPYRFSDFPADHNYASGRRSASLLNGFFPWPLLAFAFLAHVCTTISAQKTIPGLPLSRWWQRQPVFFCQHSQYDEAICRIFEATRINAARWSPEIYSLSRYVNEHGFEAKSIICVDWGLYTQFQALAPKQLRRRMHDYWPTFQTLSQKDKESQTAALNDIFPEGKSLAATFAASKETFPETRRKFPYLGDSSPRAEISIGEGILVWGEKSTNYTRLFVRRLSDNLAKRSSCFVSNSLA
jgi:hypothetical protein